MNSTTTKTINYLMIIFAFTFPVSIGAANIILAFMLLAWIMEGDFEKKFGILIEEKIVWIFFGIALLVLCSALFSHSLSDSFLARPEKLLIKVIFSHFIWIPFLLVIFITSVKKTYLNSIISAFLASIFFSELVSYLIFFQVIDPDYFKSLHLIYRGATSTNPTAFMHHTAYSVFLSISIILLLDKLLKTNHRYFQVFVLLFLLSAIANLFMNGGRTGQIAFILSVLTYVFFRFKINFKSIVLTLVILISIIFTAYHASPVFHKRVNIAVADIQKIFAGNYNTSWGVRAASNLVALDYLFSSPKHFIFGAGAGDAKKEYQAHAQKHFPNEISQPIKHLHHLHNQYLQYWFDGTIFSLLLFLFYFYLLFTLPVKTTYKPLLFSITVIVIFSIVGDILFFRYKPFILFLLVTSYFIVLSRKEKQHLSI